MTDYRTAMQQIRGVKHENGVQTKDALDETRLLKERYLLRAKIGVGSFGKVYKALDLKSQHFVAVKREKLNPGTVSQIQHECEIYQRLHKPAMVTGFPILYDFIISRSCHWMVMEMLGPTLEQLFNYCDRKFRIQIIERMRHLHQKEIIHRDIKPDNFLIGVNDTANIIYIADFGLSKQYIQAQAHIPYREGRLLTGTARYASINTHEGIEPSRRDDLESIGYMLIYFSRKMLPWQGLQGNTREEKLDKIKQKKKTTSIRSLCDKLPEEFDKYLEYTRSLAYDEDPDYNILLNLFRRCAHRLQLNLNVPFDWMQLESASK